MSGTRKGGLRARDTNLTDDPDFYRKIGAKGGKWRGPKGFATNPTLASTAGAKGGRISRRTRRISVTSDEETKLAYNGQTDRGTHRYGVPPF